MFILSERHNSVITEYFVMSDGFPLYSVHKIIPDIKTLKKMKHIYQIHLIYFFFSASASAFSLALFSLIPLNFFSDLANLKVLKADSPLS